MCVNYLFLSFLVLLTRSDCFPAASRLQQIRRTRERKQERAKKNLEAHQSVEAEKMAQLRALFESTKQQQLQQGVLQGAALPPGLMQGQDSSDGEE